MIRVYVILSFICYEHKIGVMSDVYPTYSQFYAIIRKWR